MWGGLQLVTAAGDHYGKRYNGMYQVLTLFFDGYQLFIARSKALWPFSKGTMMSHAATARAGGAGDQSDPIRFKFVPKFAGLGYGKRNCAYEQRKPTIPLDFRTCADHASFKKAGGNVGAGPQKSLNFVFGCTLIPLSGGSILSCNLVDA